MGALPPWELLLLSSAGQPRATAQRPDRGQNSHKGLDLRHRIPENRDHK